MSVAGYRLQWFWCRPSPSSAEGGLHRVSVPTAKADVLAAEQDYLTLLYQHLDERRRYTVARLNQVLSAPNAGTPQARSERDAAAAMYADQLATLDGVEQGLCFGRLDLHGGGDEDDDEEGRRYIGRLGLLDEQRDYRPLLIDWRAPAARPFYTATAARPEGVRRRRHIRTRSRTVLAVEDEVLDLLPDQDALDDVAEHSPTRISLTSEAALMAALTANRTGQMSDIVATIQAEQDRIIRAKPQGVLVVQGGPGTGKTAVALHRAAYLLYTHRRQLAKRGVLVVGPNSTFLRYIGHVLPSLGETSVLLSTVAGLHPGLHARGVEPDRTAAVKGRVEMAKVLVAAVRDRQRVPTEPIELPIDNAAPVQLDGAVCQPARTRARRSHRPHNEAKQIFQQEVVAALADQVANGLGADVLGRGDLAEIRTELRDSPELTAALEMLWPTLSPEQLLTDLYADPQRLASATHRVLDSDERDLLARPAPGPDADPELVWTPADVALLDEAAELLGSDGSAEAAREAAALRAELQYAQGVLDILDLDEDLDPELLRATDLIDADRLADRQRARGYESTADRAAADRTWTYGHIIVDEAQELSPMAWRVLMRRCPSRSMTVVGDLAQTGTRAGARSWHGVLGPYVAQRWRLEELTVNYRNPAEIAELADRVLAAIDVDITPPRSVRRSGVAPRAVQVRSLADELPAVVAEEFAAVGDGRLAVLAPAEAVGELRRVLRAPGAGDLDAPVTVLTVAQAKGLEFDAVVLVDPAAILAESPRGLNDLYVALTRTTHRLCVAHQGALPPVLAPLQP
jgi:DNA helicase IV